MYTILLATIAFSAICLVIMILLQLPKGKQLAPGVMPVAKRTWGSHKAANIANRTTWVLAAVLLGLSTFSVAFMG